MRTVAVMTAGALLAGWSPAAAQSSSPFLRVNATFAEIARATGAPGAQFALVRDGVVVDTMNYGASNVAAGAPVTDDTLFAVASCSKPLTAMAIMQLVQEGRIALDTPAFPYLRLGRPADPRENAITIRELLDHSSGLPHDVWIEGNDPLDGARAALGARLRFTPGTQQAYSNAGFVVLGAIVERASGMTYTRYVRDRILAPAGVTDEATLAQPGLTNVAVRYGPGGMPVIRNIRSIVNVVIPAGGWALSASDLARVLAAYDAGAIVSPSSRNLMLAPPVPPLAPRPQGGAFGLGWDVVLPAGDGVFFGKNGGIAGAHAWIEHRPDGLDFAVLYNGGNARGAHPIGLQPLERALDAYMGEVPTA